jgi:amidase
MIEPIKVELISATASEIQQQLSCGKLSSVDLISQCFAQIDAHNHKGMDLHALISVAPRGNTLAVAEKLDEERKAGKVRSPLHGIPVVLKDNILTAHGLGMNTTCGAQLSCRWNGQGQRCHSTKVD